MAKHFDIIIVDLAKLRDYCLNEEHPRGRHKARVFRSRLGLTVGDVELLRRALLDAARDRQSHLQATNADEFGQRYVLDFPMSVATSGATVRSAWIVLAGQDMLRLTSCYVL